MSKTAKRLKEMGVVLPKPAAPVANYVGFVRAGSLLTRVCTVSASMLKMSCGCLFGSGSGRSNGSLASWLSSERPARIAAVFTAMAADTAV